ncbi:MAG: sigma-70 family RNA polymerase sigma factor [Clostridia bacterium]|nr:sigma-70 family RNA polymerase sigma factor [Clostridia bacterium]
MERIKLEQRITENMKSIFGFALTRLGNVQESEELASDILYALIRSAENLKDEDRFYGFMWKIAENVYMDYLRRKSRTAERTAELDGNLAGGADPLLEEIVRKEELNLLRRELSLLSKQYRDATVLYYIEDLSCSETAEKLQISTEMVKYYLFRARKIIREGMNMERLYGEKSYRPCGFEIDYWGPVRFDPQEYEDFKKRKIKGNLLLAAYYSPVTIQEIAVELGVALPYLEDEIRLLEESQYLVCRNGKYLTNIPIFTLDCTKTIDEKLKKMTETTAKNYIAAADEFTSRFGDRFADENLARWQKILLCLHFSLMETEDFLKNTYGQSTENGLGVVWGRSFEKPADANLPKGIQGIYNRCEASDHRGDVIAMNFQQTLNAQWFEYGMTDPVVCTAVDCYEYLPEKWKGILADMGYAENGKANFTVWTNGEYEELRRMLGECISIVSDLNRRTSEIAAAITADLAPAHIRKTAEYVGAFVYRFHSLDNLVNALFDMNWVKEVDDRDKPAVCVIKN